MGGFATLHFGFAYPERARSLVVAGCGYGAQPDKQTQFQEEVARTAAAIESQGMAEVAKTYGAGPTRVQYQNKDPRGYAEFLAQLAEHSTTGAANTQRGVQARRPSLWELTEEMKRLDVPTLIATGDEDDPCLEPGILMKRTDPDRGAGRVPEHRACAQHRGAGFVQPDPRRFFPPGRKRPLAAPRPALGDRIDPRHVTGRPP